MVQDAQEDVQLENKRLRKEIKTLERRLRQAEDGRKRVALLKEQNDTMVHTAFSEIQRAQEAVAELNEDLERQVATRTQELELALKEAVEASRAKSNFLANTSHELRTPLNAIIGYSEMIREDLIDREETSSMLFKDAERIHDAGRHLLTIINDVINLAKIEAGHVELFTEEFDVGRMIDEVCSSVRPLLLKKNNVLSVTVAPEVNIIHSDRAKVQQVLLNLLSNAAKFTLQGSIMLDVSLKQDPQDPSLNWVHFSVKDTGEGIHAEALDRIFKPFEQSQNSTTRIHGGTGLGLALCTHFTELMGGRITLESKFGVGSTFTVILPFEAQTHGLSMLSEVSHTLDNQCVLLIDDDPQVRELIARNFAREDWTLIYCDNAMEGLARMREQRPDVILLDLMMPDVDGWEVLRLLKEDDQFFDIPIIVISMMDERVAAFELGAMDYLPKPIQRDQLIRAISRCAGRLPEEAGGLKISVVDDEPVNLDLVQRMTKDQDWEVRTYRSGADALAALDMFGPDVLILDLMMPEMDGFEVLARIRGNTDWADLPIVVYTSKELSLEECLLLEKGTTAILNKGDTSRADFIAQIQEVFSKHHLLMR